MARTYRLGWVRRAINTVATAALKLGVAPTLTYLMTTTGRRSGLARSTPLTLVEHDGHRWLVAPYGSVSWVHNVRANPTVELRRGRRRERLRAEELDAASAGPVLRRYLRAVPVTRPYFDARLNDPDTAFVKDAATRPVFELTELRPGDR